MFHNKHSYLITYCDIKIMIQTFIRINIYKPSKTMPPPILQQWRKNRKAHKVNHVFSSRRRYMQHIAIFAQKRPSLTELLLTQYTQQNNQLQRAMQYIQSNYVSNVYPMFFTIFGGVGEAKQLRLSKRKNLSAVHKTNSESSAQSPQRHGRIYPFLLTYLHI